VVLRAAVEMEITAMELEKDPLNGQWASANSSLSSSSCSRWSVEKEQMRLELEEYLKEFKNRKDENGVPFIHFPSNFDSIADAMSRKDLNSNEQKSVLALPICLPLTAVSLSFS
jgi:hypothetical protein